MQRILLITLIALGIATSASASELTTVRLTASVNSVGLSISTCGLMMEQIRQDVGDSACFPTIEMPNIVRNNIVITTNITSSEVPRWLLFVHEVLGHARLGIHGFNRANQHDDVIRTENLFRGYHNITHFRNGIDHGPQVEIDNPTELPKLYYTR